MNIRLCKCFGFVFLLGGCSENEITGPSLQTSAIPANEYGILAILVDSTFVDASTVVLVVDDSTSPGLGVFPTDSAMSSYLEYIRQHLPGLSTATTEDFRFKNSKRTFVDTPTNIHRGCIRASETDARFPWIQVSRVGFSADGKQALAYVGAVWAPLAGFGALYLLNNTAGRWSIAGSVMTWIS